MAMVKLLYKPVGLLAATDRGEATRFQDYRNRARQLNPRWKR